MPPQLISIRIFLFPFSTIKIYPYYPCLRFSLSHNTQYTIYILYNHKKYDEKAQKEGNTRNKNGAKEKRKENAAHGRIPRTRSRKPEAAGQHKQENRDDASACGPRIPPAIRCPAGRGPRPFPSSHDFRVSPSPPRFSINAPTAEN